MTLQFLNYSDFATFYEFYILRTNHWSLSQSWQALR